MQPNHRDAKQILQDGCEELWQVKPLVPAPPRTLLQPTNQARAEGFGRRSERSTFSAPSRLNLIFPAQVRQTNGVSDAREAHEACSQLVPQPLLVPVRLHAFAALVLGNFCFPSFFKRAHSDLSNCDSDSII